jgi:hypothetical protein
MLGTPCYQRASLPGGVSAEQGILLEDTPAGRALAEELTRRGLSSLSEEPSAEYQRARLPDGGRPLAVRSARSPASFLAPLRV